MSAKFEVDAVNKGVDALANPNLNEDVKALLENVKFYNRMHEVICMIQEDRTDEAFPGLEHGKLTINQANP